MTKDIKLDGSAADRARLLLDTVTNDWQEADASEVVELAKGFALLAIEERLTQIVAALELRR